MISLTLLVGTLLVVLGIVGYVTSDAASLTALIPAGVGVLLVLAAVLGRRPQLRPHAVHAAMLIALLGLLGSLMNVAQVGALLAGTAERPSAVVVSLIMAVVLIGYLAVGVRSFVAARRLRRARTEDDGRAPAA